jgi:hypothetical protein
VINFRHRNNWQSKYQSRVTEINLQGGESEICTTKAESLKMSKKAPDWVLFCGADLTFTTLQIDFSDAAPNRVLFSTFSDFQPLLLQLFFSEQVGKKGGTEIALNKNIVVILPSSGERYLSTALFADLFTEKELQQ